MPIATSKNLTIVGILIILGVLGTAGIALFDGNPETNVNILVVFTGISSGIGFIMGKGAQSTGGTVPETPEAAKRVVPEPKAHVG